MISNVLSDYKEGCMNIKIEQARELLRELDRVTDRAFSIKLRKMTELQEALNETKKQLGIEIIV
jgi:hypothetical protein